MSTRNLLKKLNKEERREVRVRARINEQKMYPRLSVFRSNKYLYAQVIDDVKGETLAAVDSKNLPKEQAQMNGEQRAKLVGNLLAKEALKKGIGKIVFDRGSYKYHGLVKALAEGAREGGLNF